MAFEPADESPDRLVPRRTLDPEAAEAGLVAPDDEGAIPFPREPEAAPASIPGAPDGGLTPAGLAAMEMDPPEYLSTAGARTYHLLIPFVVGGKEYREMTIHPPNGDELSVIARGKSPLEAIALLADVPVEAARALRWPDAEVILGYVLDVLPSHIRELLAGKD